MSVDVLILNSLVIDLRTAKFDFTNRLAGPGGLAKCRVEEMPDYSQEQIKAWIDQGNATAGGPGNTAPLMATAGLRVAVGGNVGRGEYGGLDAQGRAVCDILHASGVDVTALLEHPTLPTGTTFLDSAPGDERGGITYFPNANEDFDFEKFKPHVERLQPKVVYYMYSGLSKRGDANEGRDLAEFIRWCRNLDCLTIVDSHTLTANPAEVIRAGTPIEEYHLLDSLLPELDIFFTSSDEARLILNTLDAPRDWGETSDQEALAEYLEYSCERFGGMGRAQLFGATFGHGACATYLAHDGSPREPVTAISRFRLGEAVELTGAGDAFRAGLLTYLVRNVDAFHADGLDVNEALQVGNLTAALYLTAPLENRYSNLRPYEALLRAIRHEQGYGSFNELMQVLDGA